MTDNEMRIAIAEANRWLGPGDYLNDLNAIHQVIMAHPVNVRVFINHNLMDLIQPNDAYALDRTINATARQRAIAFLKTIGKYKE